MTRGAKPVVKTRILAKSGYAGVFKLVPDDCYSGDVSVRWVMARREGWLVVHTDPNPHDSSLKGMKITDKPSRMPAGVVPL
ncbi:hypothetical protein BJY21_002435 [Kineosphaera limosa]|uniref:Uncharacterized protein n=1 Tax=Kineosphaera limosa NBRC 100340 TaxID=1184609 RepID=K6W9S5_9MICO|nr:hypothetical protein [Kineosphaera limosa]NYE01251.1 hypothetical protein [Kineosphaera limosa]GAB95950.1 hypothetical protein KILIM_029_00600 [Kineosphaera limosa NBRC 100340]